MTPLPESNTRRWFYTYQNGMHSHILMIRGNSSAENADADAVVADLLSNVGSHFVASTIIKTEFATNGDTVRFPFPSDRLGDTFGSGTTIPQYDATELNFTGKSSGGRRMRLGLFGWKESVGDFRQNASEDSGISAFVSLLNGYTVAPCGIDNLMGLWNAYANIKPNDHWVKRSR